MLFGIIINQLNETMYFYVRNIKMYRKDWYGRHKLVIPVKALGYGEGAEQYFFFYIITITCYMITGLNKKK